MRLWYARRGIPWIPLLVCCALALLAAAVGRRWPDTLPVLLPGALACCAAAAGFVFDEAAAPVVSVTPRGAGWRRTTRLCVTVVPLVVWLAVVALLPAASEPDRVGWSTAGVACLLVAAGTAGLSARREVSAPGSSIAGLVCGLVLLPMVVGPIAGWAPLLPQGPFPNWLVVLWMGVGGLGATLGAAALRPGLHRPAGRLTARA